MILSLSYESEWADPLFHQLLGNINIIGMVSFFGATQGKGVEGVSFFGTTPGNGSIGIAPSEEA